MSVFKIANTFKRRASVFVPAQSDSGANVNTEIKYLAEFRIFKHDELAKLQAQWRENEISLGEYIDQICVGVGELKAEDGKEFTPAEGLDLRKSYDVTAIALIKEFNVAQSGEAKAKNSAR